MPAMLPVVFFIPVFINAAVLAGAIYVVVRHDGDYEWYKLLLVSLGISVVNQILSGFVVAGLEQMNVYRYDWKGHLAYMMIWGPLALISAGWLIHHYFRLMPRDAAVASVAYMVVSLGLNMLFTMWWRQ